MTQSGLDAAGWGSLAVILLVILAIAIITGFNGDK